MKRIAMCVMAVGWLATPLLGESSPPAAKPAPDSKATDLVYKGALKDGSTLTLRLKGEKTELVFANGWVIDTISRGPQKEGTEFPMDLAALGHAGDWTLAVSGPITEKEALLEVKRGVGIGAQTQTCKLTRTKP